MNKHISQTLYGGTKYWYRQWFSAKHILINSAINPTVLSIYSLRNHHANLMMYRAMLLGNITEVCCSGTPSMILGCSAFLENLHHLYHFHGHQVTTLGISFAPQVARCTINLTNRPQPLWFRELNWPTHSPFVNSRDITSEAVILLASHKLPKN